ncbi:MAG: type II toxin-antitoxin system YhaV family toxin [Candidatus Omnitrophica bacterium]|nr:type II toxin-antitoxin system YhaV family toxin [Candidatus Omnitrophota bacterium]
MSKYLLKAHDFYDHRIRELTEQVRELKEKLEPDQFTRHPTVKFARRIREADKTIIPRDPDRPEYWLRADLKKFRRYKRGLKRYRLFFCFANHPKIILYLYLNDEKHLRKDGDKNDPYEVFKKFLKQGSVSHNPEDPKIQKWVHKSSGLAA